MSQQPNILLILTDDQRYDTIAALGQSEFLTPNMDRLVQMGTSFTQAHIPSGTSAAVCCPSRAMLHTGRSLFHLEGCGESIPDAHTTLGEFLGQQGYQTFGCGKWHNGKEAFNRSFQEGDDIFFGGMGDHWNVPCFHYDPTGAYAGTLAECHAPFTSREVTYRPGTHIHSGEHSSDVLAQCTHRWLRERQKDSPFFAYLSFLAPHDPRTMPQEFKDRIRPEDVELPPNFLGGHPFDTGALHIRDEMLEDFPRDPNKVKVHIAEYQAMIMHLDHCIGKVLDTLEASGELDHTLIVLAGDNGLAVGQHGLMGKQSHYEHSIRVPLVVAGPGVESGRVTDTPVYLFDIFSTICEHLGLERPSSVEGESFAHELKGETRSTREALFFAYEKFQRSVKKEKYKYIEYVVDGRNNMTQLFNLQDDPWELYNLASSADHAVVCEEMKTELLSQAKAWDDDISPWGKTFWDGYRSSNAETIPKTFDQE